MLSAQPLMHRATAVCDRPVELYSIFFRSPSVKAANLRNVITLKGFAEILSGTCVGPNRRGLMDSSVGLPQPSHAKIEEGPRALGKAIDGPNDGPINKKPRKHLILRGFQCYLAERGPPNKNPIKSNKTQIIYKNQLPKKFPIPKSPILTIQIRAKMAY